MTQYIAQSVYSSQSRSCMLCVVYNVARFQGRTIFGCAHVSAYREASVAVQGRALQCMVPWCLVQCPYSAELSNTMSVDARHWKQAEDIMDILTCIIVCVKPAGLWQQVVRFCQSRVNLLQLYHKSGSAGHHNCFTIVLQFCKTWTFCSLLSI